MKLTKKGTTVEFTNPVDINRLKKAGYTEVVEVHEKPEKPEKKEKEAQK